MLVFRYFPKSKLLSFLFITIFLIANNNASACTRVLNANNGQAVLVGRTMDWTQDMHDNLWVYPRGLEREGMASGNSLKWQSKYGSVVETAYDLVTTDGMNEKGLAAHMLWLHETDYGVRNEKIHGLSIIFWAQFYLDNFQTVDEAVRFTKSNIFQIEDVPDQTAGMKIHLALEDASGDSAILEYINGNLRIYQGPQYPVLTNSPTVDQQMLNLQQYTGFGGYKPLPGTTESKDRFVRATYYNKNWVKPQTLRDALTEMLSVVQNVSEPYGIANAEYVDLAPTLWRSVIDLTHRVYYFNLSTSLNITWTTLDKFKLDQGSPIMKLDLSNSQDLSGDVSGFYKIATDIQDQV